MALQGVKQLPSAQIPYAYAAIPAGAGQQLAAGVKGHQFNRFGMAMQKVHQLIALRIPQADRAIPRAARQQRAIAAKGERHNPIVMPVPRSDRLPGLGIPNSHGMIQTATRNQAPAVQRLRRSPPSPPRRYGHEAYAAFDRSGDPRSARSDPSWPRRAARHQRERRSFRSGWYARARYAAPGRCASHTRTFCPSLPATSSWPLGANTSA